MQQEQQKVSSRSTSSSPELNPRVVKNYNCIVEEEKNTLYGAASDRARVSTPRFSGPTPPIRRFERKKEAPCGLHRSCLACNTPRVPAPDNDTFRGAGVWSLAGARLSSRRVEPSERVSTARRTPTNPFVSITITITTFYSLVIGWIESNDRYCHHHCNCNCNTTLHYSTVQYCRSTTLPS